MSEFYHLNIKGYETDLPIVPLPNGLKICFFNLHGNVEMTEHCARELAKLVADCDVILTAESKGLQLSHVMARELGHPYYAVCRKSKKLYMQDGLEASVTSITTGHQQTLYLSKHDADLIRGKKVAIVDDVVSTGGSLLGMEKINGMIDALGFTGTRLNRKLFRPELSAQGIQNYVSARDMGRLMEMLLKGELVSPDASREMLAILGNQRLNGKIPFYLHSRGIPVAHKTGEDDGITHDVGVIFAEKTCVVCFLSNETDVPMAERAMQDIAATAAGVI